VLPPLTIVLIAHKSITLSLSTTRSAVVEAWATMIAGGLLSVIIALVTSRRLPQRDAAVPGPAPPSTAATAAPAGAAPASKASTPPAS